MSTTRTISGKAALAYLIELGQDRDRAVRALGIAKQYGHKAVAHEFGIMDVFCVEFKNGGSFRIRVPEKKSAGIVAPVRAARYTSSSTSVLNKSKPGKRRTIMAPRGRAAAVQAEPEHMTEEETEKDYTAYADKEATPTMADFTEWLEEEVYGGVYSEVPAERDAFLDGVRLGGTLRMEYQRSDFCRDRREQRRAERATATAETETETEGETGEEAKKPAKPARGPRTAAKPVAAKAASKPAASAPARSRPRRGAAAATAEAPF